MKLALVRAWCYLQPRNEKISAFLIQWTLIGFFLLQILALTPFFLISGTLDVGNNALDMSKKEIIDDAFYILLWAPLVETIVFQLAATN